MVPASRQLTTLGFVGLFEGAEAFQPPREITERLRRHWLRPSVRRLQNHQRALLNLIGAARTKFGGIQDGLGNHPDSGIVAVSQFEGLACPLKSDADRSDLFGSERHVLKQTANWHVNNSLPDIGGTLLSTKSPLFDESGKIVGIIGVSTDITEREGRAKQLEFVMHELTHRSKNLLTIVQSVARQSIRQSSNLEDFESKFVDRLSSLASLHDLLVQMEWQGASLRAIAETQVGPFAFGRMEFDGPEILLKPNMAQIIAMAFHELATNAAKHGALSNNSGTVLIKWGFEGEQQKTIFIKWQEAGGPVVAIPVREGFGSIVLQRTALQIPDSSASLQFLPSGVVWDLKAPLKWLVDTQ